MIRYALQCSGGHRFESWFPSSSSFDAQLARGLVACPSCGSTTVEKAMMAPAIARSDPAPAAESAPADAPDQPLVSPAEVEVRTLMRRIREHVVKTSDYVGDAFAGLARKMHEGDVERRSIYGEATPDDIESLREDEIDVFPLPVLPDDRN